MAELLPQFFLWALACCCAVAAVAEETPPTGPQAPGAIDVTDTRSPDQWHAQLVEWRDRYREARRAEDAAAAEAIEEQVRAIRDPNARRPMLSLFNGERAGIEKLVHKKGLSRDREADEALKVELREARNYTLRPAYLEVLAAIGGPGTFDMLVRLSVSGDTPAVAHTAAELIRKSENRKDAVPRYIRYLRSRDHAHDAARALRETGLAEQVSMAEDPDPALTKALIDALIDTKTSYRRAYYHRQWIRPGSGRGNPGLGYSGESSWVLVPQHSLTPNDSVLHTLVDYTGENFGFNKRAWQEWYDRHVKRRNAGKR